MRVTIDTDVCIGAGQCVLTAPQVFTQDDDGFSELLPGCEDGTADPMLREAARACPVRAITLHTDRFQTEPSSDETLPAAPLPADPLHVDT